MGAVDDVIQVWKLALDLEAAQVARLAATLQPDEHAHAKSFRFDVHRNRYIVGRAALRQVLGRTLDMPPSHVRFRYTDRGKPELDHTMNQAWQFNLSHSAHLALIAVARGRRLGVDIELVEHNMLDLEGVARIFSDDEQAAIKALPAERQTEGFFRCWVRKEAYVKAQGLGITCELKDFSVDIHPDRAGLLRAERSMANQTDWHFAVLDQIENEGAGYAAALVYEGLPARITCSDGIFRGVV